MTLLRSCRIYLQQGYDLASGLDSVQYTLPHTSCFGGTIGGHIRHCLDHFERLMEGLPSGKVDYDCRERGGPSEVEPEAACQRILLITNLLLQAEDNLDEDQEIIVKLDCGGEDAHWKRSTVGRELQFLVSHMVHHFAIIGIMCQAIGKDLPENFGLAPSTIRHQMAG
ncbi:MAG: DinB family protein [Verrucomicrobiota bacterium]